MAGNSILAWTNLVKTASLTAGSSATNLPVTNIADDNGSASLGWQTVSGVLSVAAGALITVTPLVNASPIDVVGIFRSNLTSGASVTISIYQNPSTLIWSSVLQGPVSGYGQVIGLPPAGTVCDYVTIGFDDLTNPDGFVNVALVYVGSAWRPLGSAGFSSTVGRDSTILETVSRGGQEFSTLLFQRRRWNFQLDAMRTAETWASADVLAQYGAGGSNVFFIPDVASLYVQQEAIFGRLKSSADISYPFQAADRRRWSGSITERL